MGAKPHIRFSVPDRSFANMAKRDITRIAESFGFSDTDVGRVNIVVAELISNLVKFSKDGGELLIKPLGEPVHGLEILSLDSGPGMSNLKNSLQDGFSTAGSAGEGMGAIVRQSQEFDLYTLPGVGTVVLSRILKSRAQKIEKPAAEVGAVMVAKNGETACGDGWTIMQQGKNTFLLALDGLGHGVDAETAANAAVEQFQKIQITSPVDIIRYLHESIRRTRGAVGTIVHLQPDRQKITYCGVGNISGKIFKIEGSRVSSSVKNIISYNGIIGHNIPNSLNNQQTEWGLGQVMVLHSDGLKSRWDISKYPDLLRHDPTVIAAVLYKDHTRGTDDTLVIVSKSKP